ncbi:MAG: 50S ribosomal protein L15 [Hyphomicrobiaceae bacterium]
MRLNELKDNDGASKQRVRVGRGIGSGIGKTSGRGHKGQNSRSGVAMKGFEGGQMPLYRRLPKRGFKKWRRKNYNALNIGVLQAAIDAGRVDPTKPLDLETLVAAGVLRRAKDGLRVLGKGELTAKIAITANHVTPGARSAIESAGGEIALVEQKILAADEEKRAKTAAKKAKT